MTLPLHWLIVSETTVFLQPLTRAAGDRSLVPYFMEVVGWRLARISGFPTAQFEGGLAALHRAFQTVRRLQLSGTEDLSVVKEILDVSESTLIAARDLSLAFDSIPAGALRDVLSHVPGDILEFLMYSYLRVHPRVEACLWLVGVWELDAPVETTALRLNGEEVRSPRTRPHFNSAMVHDWLVNPRRALESCLPGLSPLDTDVLSAHLFPRVTRLLQSFGINSTYNPATRATTVVLQQGASTAIFGATLRRIDNALWLAGNATGRLAVESTRGRWMIGTQVGLEGDFLLGTGGVRGAARGAVALSIRSAAEDGSADLVVGGASSTRFEIGKLRASLGLEMGAEGRGNWSLSIEVERGKLVVSPVESDSFVSGLSGGAALEVAFGFGVRFSSQRGFQLTEGSGLRLAGGTTSVTVGALRFSSFELSVAPASNDRIAFEISTDLDLHLGPISGSLRKLGISLSVNSGEGTSTGLGASLGLRAPDGVAVSLSSGPVQGGGFIAHERSTYTGSLSLSIGDVSVFALGVVQTELPGGVPGYSFLVLITAEFPGIPLGFGFKLSGVGGLVGINRQVAVEALQRGVQDGSLAGILFPSRDALRNPTGVLAGVQRVFPPVQGQHVVAPVVKISWGTPTVMEAVIGLVIRFPDLLIGLLGRISVRLPLFNDEAPVRINVLIAGVVDPGQKLIDIRASLYDSRIIRYVLAGDMAFRLRWGDQPDFMFSFGGFHPRFRAPAGYPTLRRLSVSIGNDFGARLTVETFLAVTSNTLQLGARAMVDVEVAEIFSVHGEIYVYGMITFEPFSFRLDFGVHLSLRRGSTNLLGIHVEGFVEGPGPWRIQGHASISVLFFEIGADFDLRFGAPATPAPRVPLPDVLAQLATALGDVKNWNAELAAGAERLVTLGRVEGSEPVLDPMAGLTVRQKVAPLQRPLQRFGQIDLPTPQTLRITEVQLGDDVLTPGAVHAVQEWFAPGQFFRLSQADQLSRESFTRMDAGISIAEDAVDIGGTAQADLGVEAILVECPPPGAAVTAEAARTSLGTHTLPVSLMLADLRRQSRAARQSGGGLGQYLPEVLTPLVALAPELHVIVNADTFAVVSGTGDATDVYEAHRRLEARLDERPEERGRLQVVPIYLTRRAA